jgi:hypothetical protein
MNAVQEIHALLETFQEGYIRRDVSTLEPFMELFTPDLEVIGTNAVTPGKDEWHIGRESAREIFKGDWESWGDLILDLDSATIKVHENTGWIAVPATVTMTIGDENYSWFLNFIKDFIDKSTLPPEQKLHYILRGGTNTVYELSRGEKFVWPLRLTAVVVREADTWKFAQLHFSFPTTNFPDVRIIDQV